MKVLLLTLVLAAAVLAAPDKKKDEGTYTTKWDGIDLDQILASERLLKNYVDCLMGRKNCTPDGSDLKRILPDALKTDCSKCSEAQKKGSDKVVKYLIKNKKDWWAELEQKYDSTGEHRARHPEIYQ